MSYRVDLVIAAHDPARNVRRAVASALAGSGGHVRVTVVCHNRNAAEFAHHWEGLPGERHVRPLELRDGIPSPAGPFNAGIEAATAPWVGVMDSDDELEPGALRSWEAQARAQELDLLMARVSVAGKQLLTPRLRPFRRGLPDLVKDRVFYRTAPLGLMRRETLMDQGIRHTS